METIGKFDELFSRNMFCDILAGFINARFATGRNSTDNEDRFSVIKNAVETLAMIYDNYLTNKEYNRKKDFDNSGSIGELYAMLSDFAGQHGISAQNEF